MIVAAGMAGVKHPSSFHRVFAAARWSLDAFGLGRVSPDRTAPGFQQSGALVARRYAGPQVRPENLRRGNAPRSAPIESRAQGDAVGTELRRAVRDCPLSTLARSPFLVAGPGAAVPEAEAGGSLATQAPHAARVCRGVVGNPLPPPSGQAFSRGGRQRLRRGECAGEPAEELRLDQPVGAGRPIVRRTAQPHRQARPPPRARRKTAHARRDARLATLRRESAREFMAALGLTGPGKRKITHTIEHFSQLAA